MAAGMVAAIMALLHMAAMAATATAWCSGSQASTTLAQLFTYPAWPAVVQAAAAAAVLVQSVVPAGVWHARLLSCA